MRKLQDEILQVEQAAGIEALVGETPGHEGLRKICITVNRRNRKQEKRKLVEQERHLELELTREEQDAAAAIGSS